MGTENDHHKDECINLSITYYTYVRKQKKMSQSQIYIN